MKSLYFECHVTIEPIFDEARERAGVIAERNGFKLAKLLMQKRSADEVKRSKYDTFMTGHSQTYHDVLCRMISLIAELKEHGFKVWRYKIEDCVLDSRSADTLALL